MKANELKNLSISELKQKKVALNQEIFNIKFQKSTGQLGNTSIICKTKKDLARINTILKQMELSGETKRG